MSKKSTKIVMTNEKREEIAKYISNMRQNLEFWFVGTFEADDLENPETMKSVCETLRGHFPSEGSGEIWAPFESERAACCDAVNPSDAEPFLVQDHCKTYDHCLNLVNGMSNARQEYEYKRMLENVFDSLAEDWS